MATPHTATVPASADPRVQRLAKKLQKHRKAWVKTQPLSGGWPAGYRPLATQVEEHTGPLRGDSHEQIRKMHLGLIAWPNIEVRVVLGLAAVYDVSLEELSPDFAKELALMGSTQGIRKKRCTSPQIVHATPVAA